MAIKGYVGVIKKYTPIEYLESTGTQWIDTEILPTSNTRIVADLSFTVNSSITATNFMGWSSSGSAETLAFGIGAVDNVLYFRGACSSNSTYITFGDADSNRHTFDISNSALKFDGVSYGTGNIGNTAAGNQTLFLLARHIEWWDTTYGAYLYGNVQCARQKFYSCQIYNGNTLIRNFIPALDECNKPCIVDLVNNKFYYNQGWGNFNIGETTGSQIAMNVSVAQQGSTMYVGVLKYKTIEYIESTGTQYIDTGIKHNNNTRVVAKVSYSNVPSAGWYYPFGSFGGAKGTNKLFCAEINNSNKLGTYYATSHVFSINYAGVHTYDLNKNVHKIDNTTYTYSSSSFQSDFNFIIFGATNYDGGIAISKVATKLYYLQIYDNGTLVRDFIPVKDANGIACLYDNVTKQFFYNKGTDENFTAGNEIGDPVEVAREIRKGYVGVNGVAKQCYEPKIKYLQTVDGLANLNSRRTATIGEYFILATGYTHATAQAIGKDLTIYNLADISAIRYWSNGAAGKKYAFFGGGYNGRRKANVDCYDASLVHAVPTNLSAARSTAGGSSIGNYTLIAGGDSSNTRVDVYDNDTLSRTTGTNLATGRKEIYGTFNSTYACFGGGYNVTTVDLYNSNLVHSNPAALSTSSGRRNPQNCEMQEEFFIFGGATSNVVDCYDINLARTTLATLSYQSVPTCIGFDTEILVIPGVSYSNFCDIYDKNHVKRTEKLPRNK